MLKRILIIVGIFAALAFTMPYGSRAAECKQISSTDPPEIIQAVIDKCDFELGELRNQKKTLADELKYLDTQTYVTQLEINKNEIEVTKLQKEIENLGERIDEIDTNVDKISLIVSRKISDIYKKQKTNNTYALLDINNLSSLLRSLEYLQKSQENDRHLLLKLQNTKVNFQTQKSLRQTKEEELQKVNTKLEGHKITLRNQQQEKKNLLAITQSDEKTYQQLLAEARNRITRFENFTAASGADGIIGANALGTGYDGTYYSQRDERWANFIIGNSNKTILSVGCLVSSVAMVLKSKGVDVNPISIASNPSYFVPGPNPDMYYRTQLDLWGHRGQWISKSEIDSYLNSEHPQPVIVGVGNGPDHFLVLKKIVDGNWIMFDPIYGPDKKFTDHYSVGQISSAEIII